MWDDAGDPRHAGEVLGYREAIELCEMLDISLATSS